MELNVENAELVLKKYLEGSNQSKYEHSKRVADISLFLAEKWGAAVSDSVIASLLHDVGKAMSKQEMLSLCMRNNITVYDFELFESITALHGRISALIFEEEFKGNDKERISLISHAISSHVSGDMNMNLLDKIVFIADNLDSKQGSKEILEQIKSDTNNNPDYYIKKLVEGKVKRSKEKNWEYNPLLDAMLEGLEGKEEIEER